MKDAAVMPMHNLSVNFLKDLHSSMIDLVDSLFMTVYKHTRKNSHRMTRLAVALLPLMMLLVGSCKTAQISWGEENHSPAEQFRAALFPASHTALEVANHPAQGYIASARAYIADAPEKLNNLTKREIGYLFGRPSFHRRDADAEIWQYKSGYCVVDFYFYNQKNVSDNAVAYVDFRMKTDLVSGSAPRADMPSLHEQSKCLRNVSA